MTRILFDLRFLSSLKKISGLKTDNLKSSIFWFSCKAIARTTSFITLILAFLFSGSKLKAYELLDSKYFPYLKKKMLEAAPIVTILLIFLPSALLSDFVMLNSFSIVINNELYEEDEEQILVVTIKIGGFASVDDPTQITVWVYSDKWERKSPISLDNQGYEKGFYRVFIIVTDFKEGIHYVEVVSSSAKETFRKREEFL